MSARSSLARFVEAFNRFHNLADSPWRETLSDEKRAAVAEMATVADAALDEAVSVELRKIVAFVGHVAKNYDSTLNAGWEICQRWASLNAEYLTARTQSAADADGGAKGERPIDATTFLSARDLANRYSLPYPSTESALRRFRNTYAGTDCFVETDEGRQKNEPRFLYRHSAVHDLLARMVAKVRQKTARGDGREKVRRTPR